MGARLGIGTGRAMTPSMTMTTQTLQSLATSGLLIATEHGVYRPHDGVTEYADCPETGHRWDGAQTTETCPYSYLECDVSLMDSNTREELTADDLGITELAYHEAIIESLGDPSESGHIVVSGRTVYAA